MVRLAAYGEHPLFFLVRKRSWLTREPLLVISDLGCRKSLIIKKGDLVKEEEEEVILMRKQENKGLFYKLKLCHKHIKLYCLSY